MKKRKIFNDKRNISTSRYLQSTSLYIHHIVHKHSIAAPCADIRNFPYLYMIDVILKLLYLPVYQTLSVTL